MLCFGVVCWLWVVLFSCFLSWVCLVLCCPLCLFGVVWCCFIGDGCCWCLLCFVLSVFKINYVLLLSCIISLCIGACLFVLCVE